MKLALDFLSHCYHIDVDFTQQLLTDDLINFSNTTCVTLAVDVMHYDFVAHNCCQNLINDIWMGGLQTRKNSSIKVSFLFIELYLIVFYIFILCLSDTVNVKMFNCRKFRKYLFIITSILTKIIQDIFLLIDSIYKQTLSYTNIANLQVSMIAGDNK